MINCAASKILEGVLHLQLQEHMESNQIFSPSQHAYRRKRSCESALVDLDTMIQKARNEGKVVGLVMTNMSAAFNPFTPVVPVGTTLFLTFYNS